MTFAGFFVHLNSIPQELRWLQWMCPLKYALEALSVNEVNSGLEIQDTLQGVPVNVSASLIMNIVRFSSVIRFRRPGKLIFGASYSDLTRKTIIATCSCYARTSWVSLGACLL